ncbi:MAG TPA: DNA-processing protein DprA [Puia sp.]|jgi:DNA processing protein|nr:DNA-processing protein DprA [Puia sp.]
MENNTLYQLALCRIHGIGPAHTKKLIEHFGDPRSIFHADRTALERTGLNEKLIDAILNFSDYDSLRKELRHLQQIGARTLFYTEPDYPKRLLPLANAPALLFYQGTANLNTAKIIAIAGTRNPTPYGRQMTAELVSGLTRPDLLIISGLAFGIDAIAHQTAMKCHIPTIGVLGHGLDHVYPALHRGLFHAMRRHDGILTSFLHETKPDKYTFPVRNQLVAGLCDALIVIESSSTGGSLSAAAAALKFQKKVFALPGRITDEKSQGCLQLILGHQALPLISVDQLKAAIGWDCPSGRRSHQQSLPFSATKHSGPAQPKPTASIPAPQKPEQPNRAPSNANIDLPNPTPSNADTDLPDPAPSNPNIDQPVQEPSNPIIDPIENQLVNLLTAQQPLSFEDLLTLSHQPVPSISVALLNLEIRGIIRSLPGRRYRLAS